MLAKAAHSCKDFQLVSLYIDGREGAIFDSPDYIIILHSVLS